MRKENFLSQGDFLKRVWDRLENPGKISEIKSVFDAICTEMQQVFMEEKGMGLPGVGVFSIERGAPRRIRHVLTGQIVFSRGKKKVKFSPSAPLKRHFEKERDEEMRNEEE